MNPRHTVEDGGTAVEADDRTGARLRQLRRLRGLTQHQLANRLLSVSLVRKIEQGFKPPSSSFVASAARTLGVTPAYLYGTEERDAAERPQADTGGIGELRTAMDAYDDPRPEGEPLTLDAAIGRLGTTANASTAHVPATVAAIWPTCSITCSSWRMNQATTANGHVQRYTMPTAWRPASQADSGNPTSLPSLRNGTYNSPR